LVTVLKGVRSTQTLAIDICAVAAIQVFEKIFALLKNTCAVIDSRRVENQITAESRPE
jgi:hypothetical protein